MRRASARSPHRSGWRRCRGLRRGCARLKGRASWFLTPLRLILTTQKQVVKQRLQLPVAQTPRALPAEDQARAVGQHHRVPAAALRKDLANAIAVDDGRSMDAREALRIQAPFEIAHRSREEGALARRVDARVVAFRL